MFSMRKVNTAWSATLFHGTEVVLNLSTDSYASVHESLVAVEWYQVDVSKKSSAQETLKYHKEEGQCGNA